MESDKLVLAVSISSLPSACLSQNGHRSLEPERQKSSPEWLNGSTLTLLGHLLPWWERKILSLALFSHPCTHFQQPNFICKGLFLWQHVGVFFHLFHVTKRSTLRFSRPKERGIHLLIPFNLQKYLLGGKSCLRRSGPLSRNTATPDPLLLLYYSSGEFGFFEIYCKVPLFLKRHEHNEVAKSYWKENLNHSLQKCKRCISMVGPLAQYL